MKNDSRIILALSIGGLLLKSGIAISGDQQPNILLFTADDLDKNSLGCYGSGVPGITPNIDRFASEGVRFNHAFVNASICAPSRAIIATGLYGHNSGAMGFMKIADDSKVPLLMEILREHSFCVGILGKVSHSTPKNGFKWDLQYDQNQLGDGRNPGLYYEKAREFFKKCRDEQKPFYFMVNSHDPHRPFYNPSQKGKVGAGRPSRIYSPGEVVIPGFVPDLPGVREEISYYYNSVKRLDDTFGRVMDALEESGFANNTLVIFISDNGIAIPFAKCNAYYPSNRTPWLVRWPGVIRPGRVDDRNLISEVDLMPTILEAVNIAPPPKLDGSSHLTIYKGEKMKSGKMIYCQIDSKAGGGPVPMRSIQSRKYLYVFNAWADGERVYGNNNEGMTMRAMEDASLTNDGIRNRVELFRYRKLEEFFNLQNDPDCLVDLVAKPVAQKQVKILRKNLEKWMVKTRDPLLEVFRVRNNPEKMRDALYKSYPDAKNWDKDKANYSK